MPNRLLHRRFPSLAVSLLTIGLLALVPEGQAWASETSAGSEDGTPDASDPLSIAIPVLIAPVVDNGRLVGYLYLGLKVVASGDDAAERMRDELPLLQDRILRAFNNAPIAAADANTDAAKAALIKTATAALAGLAEAQGVKEVTLTDIQNVPF